MEVTVRKAYSRLSSFYATCTYYDYYFIYHISLAKLLLVIYFSSKTCIIHILETCMYSKKTWL